MTPIFATTRSSSTLPYHGLPEHSSATQANRRRRLVFGAVLVLACVASLSYVFLRPAEYRATARWQFVFAERDDPAPAQRPLDANPATAQPPQDGNRAFLTEMLVITSRPLLEKLPGELQSRGLALPAASGDAVDALQRSIEARPVPGTTIVEVRANGQHAELLAPMLNTLFEIYRRQLDESHRARSGDAHAQARDEAALLQARVAERRRAVDDFRSRYNIVSLEREENQVLAQVKGQGNSLNLANDKVVAAEARLRSLRESVAAGKAVARARDNPTLANLEQRHSQAREELRAMEQSYTEAYMTLDPNAKAVRVRLANLEEQLKQAREAAQQAALADAEEELAGARLAAERVSQQMSSARQSVQSFTARMAEYKAMQGDLDRLEGLHGAAAARATGIESGSRRAAPALRLLEPASTPHEPWRPNYARDAAAAVAGSLLLALLSMGLVEMLNRPEAPATLVMARDWVPLGRAPGVRPFALGAAAVPVAGAPAPTPLLEANPLPRELNDAEVAALIGAAAPHARPVLVALLSGLSANEVAGLNRRDMDLSESAIRLPDRTLALAGPLAGMLARLVNDGTASDAPLLCAADGRRQTMADIDASVIFAAHDAGLAHAGEVSAAALRHTCVAHLVRQGARFGDLARWVGRLPTEALGVYGALAPEGPKQAAEDIDPVLPALHRLVC